jgi:hypothetical protein
MRKELAFQSEEIFKFCQCYTKNKIARPKVGQQVTAVLQKSGLRAKFNFCAFYPQKPFFIYSKSVI